MDGNVGTDSRLKMEGIFIYLYDKSDGCVYLWTSDNSSSSPSDNSNSVIKMTDSEFNQWLAGFIDGEGSFAIVINENIISFRFSIKLHIDDLDALMFIKYRLNCGNIYIRSDLSSASFELNKISDIQTKLIPLLDKFPLNGIKYLDYLAFKEAINIKLDESILKSKKFELITALKDSMNNKRVNFEMPDTHTIRITPYWLLGLIEGEGSFSLSNPKTMAISFTLSLTAAQTPLINAIKNYLGSYIIVDARLKSSPDYLEIINKIVFVYARKKRREADKPQIEITLKQIKFIHDKFIPMLFELNFVTKKYKDFLVWAFIASLIYKGKHTTKAGRELIIKISKSMNRYRLSTYKHQESKVKIAQSLMDLVLNMDDVYIKGEDGLRIKASDGTLVSRQLFYILASGSNGEKLIFKSSDECADYFKVTSQTINVKIAKRQPVLDANNTEFLLSRKPI